MMDQNAPYAPFFAVETACRAVRDVTPPAFLTQMCIENVAEIRDNEEYQTVCHQTTGVPNGPGTRDQNDERGNYGFCDAIDDQTSGWSNSNVNKNGISSEKCEQHNEQELQAFRCELFGCGTLQNNSGGQNEIILETPYTQENVPCSLGPSPGFDDEIRDDSQTECVPFQCQVDGAVSSQCPTDNARSEPLEGTSAPVTYCISAGAEPTYERRHSGSGGHTANQGECEPDATQRNTPVLSSQEQWQCGNGVCTFEEETDLIIEVSGKKLRAHKTVLTEKSEYFKARQSRDFLRVKGLSFTTLNTLVDFIYSSRMQVSKDNVVEVITGAKILQIPCAVQAAVDTMSEQITTENCYEILTIAKKQRLSELKEKAYRFMSDNFLQILRDRGVYGRLTGGERELILKSRMDGKKSLMVAEINEVYDRVGSRPPSRESSRPQSPLSIVSLEDNYMIHYYNEESKDWKCLTRMPDEVNTKGCGICTMYNYLFVAGGIKGQGDKGKLSDKVFCYNPITDTWSEIRPLNQPRSQLKLVSMDGYLYAIGGECLFTVEKYDPRVDRWSSVAPLPKGAFAVAHEATTCNGELYVSGGSLFYRLLKYDPKRDEWQESPYNNSRKKSADMVAFKNFIYRFDVNREQGINVFKYNTVVKMWHDSASLAQTNPVPFRCAVMSNCIYCVNKNTTLQFIVEEENAQFAQESLKAPLEAKGALFPFILRLPDKA